MENPSFADLAKFIREWVALPRKKQIVPDTRFEEDLGITGDDGCELLEAIQKHFNAPLCEVGYGYRRTSTLALMSTYSTPRVCLGVLCRAPFETSQLVNSTMWCCAL